MSPFNLHFPWWITGESGIGVDRPIYQTIVAAIPTESAQEAEEIILNSFDKRPEDIEWRFNSLKEGSPYSDRFQKTGWMQWPDDRIKENEK